MSDAVELDKCRADLYRAETWLANARHRIADLEQKLTAAESQPAVPEGFVLAPVEPTDEMIDAGCKQHICPQQDIWYSDDEISERDCIDIYKAMLAAAKEQK